MSERIIRINKVLRVEYFFGRAVDYLKDKGIAIEANQNTKISDDVYNVLCGFAGDRGKRGFKEVGEEKRKRKRLCVEREKKSKINVSMMKSSKQQEVIKREL
jgi:translation initiation factor IF-2